MEYSEKTMENELVEQVKSEQPIEAIDLAAEKRLLWKLDIHVVPILTLLFLLAFLDRINIGNARLQGLEEDLNMKGRDYNIALFIFFIPYILFEVPCNLILKKVAPSWWISGLMFAWGKLEMFLYDGCFASVADLVIFVNQGLSRSVKASHKVLVDWWRVASC